MRINKVYIPMDLRKLVRKYFPNVDFNGYYIGGGFIRSYFEGKPAKDLDVFLKDINNLSTVEDQLIKIGYKKKTKSAFAITYTKNGFDIQIITCRVGTLEHILEDFDFTVCQAMIDQNFLYTSSEFDKDIQKKVLRITEAAKERCATTLERCFRYASYGYKMSRRGMEELVDLIHNATDSRQLKFNYAGLKEQSNNANETKQEVLQK